MQISLSIRNILKSVSLVLYIAILAVITFYILPKLLTLFWNSNVDKPKFRDEILQEKPLRVELLEKNKKKYYSTGNERKSYIFCRIDNKYIWVC